ncbi:serine/arginine repetitive matrix protein 2-like [Planococcus citri]|uniref:serine/arginine repetitive matrix protein 2-like n=1 Tax=Planococcus citri TaxID=170843 RepID=UPI0031FA2C09
MADELEAFMRAESNEPFFEPTEEQEEMLLLAERGESMEFPDSPDDLDYEPMSSPKPKSPRKNSPKPKSPRTPPPKSPAKSPSKSPNSTKKRIDKAVGEIAEAVLSPSRNVEPTPSGSGYVFPEQGSKPTRPAKVTIDRTRARKSSPKKKVSSTIQPVDNIELKGRNKKPLKPAIKSPSKSPKYKSPTYKPQSPKKAVSFKSSSSSLSSSASSFSSSSVSTSSSSYSSSSSSASSVPKRRSRSPNRSPRKSKSPSPRRSVFERLSTNEENLKKEIRGNKITITDLRSQLKSRKNEIRNFEEAILDEKRRREEDRRQIQNLNRRITEKNRTIDENLIQIQRLSEQVGEQATTINNQTNTISNLQAQLLRAPQHDSARVFLIASDDAPCQYVYYKTTTLMGTGLFGAVNRRLLKNLSTAAAPKQYLDKYRKKLIHPRDEYLYIEVGMEDSQNLSIPVFDIKKEIDKLVAILTDDERTTVIFSYLADTKKPKVDGRISEINHYFKYLSERDETKRIRVSNQIRRLTEMYGPRRPYFVQNDGKLVPEFEYITYIVQKLEADKNWSPDSPN